MKNLYLLTILFVIVLFSVPSICQPDNSDIRIIQLATGKDNITFTVLDYETNEPLIGAEIYSFNLKKVLATTDIDGVAITENELVGNLEVSYIAYYSICFKLDDKSIDSIQLWMKPSPLNLGDGVVDLDTNTVSPSENGKIDSEQDLIDNKIQLLINSEPTEEQFIYAKNHNFKFKIWQGSKRYREAYNAVVIDFLNKKYERNIEEDLREICWRNYQP